MTEELITNLDARLAKLNRTIGKQKMQIAVLKWATENRSVLDRNWLIDGLLNIIETELGAE